MLAKEILAFQRKQPFPGLRIHVSDGQSYKVRHPELMTVTASLVFIALPPLANDLPESWVTCDPVHITRIEPINGRSRRASRKRKL